MSFPSTRSRRVQETSPALVLRAAGDLRPQLQVGPGHQGPRRRLPGRTALEQGVRRRHPRRQGDQAGRRRRLRGRRLQAQRERGLQRRVDHQPHTVRRTQKPPANHGRRLQQDAPRQGLPQGGHRPEDLPSRPGRGSGQGDPGRLLG